MSAPAPVDENWHNAADPFEWATAYADYLTEAHSANARPMTYDEFVATTYDTEG